MAAQSKKPSTPVDEELRALPNNPDAEKSVLGAILLDNAALLPAMEVLVPSDFFLTQNGRVFTEMCDMHMQQLPIEMMTVVEQLRLQGDLEACGGSAYISSLSDGVPRIASIEHYCRIVKEKSILRQLIHLTDKIQLQAFEGEGGADAVVAAAKEQITSLADTDRKGHLEPLKLIVRDNFAAVEKIFTDGRSITGVPTGYTGLDELTGGLQAKELIILAARPSVGKSSFMLNLTENVSVRAATPTAIFSLEMSKMSLLIRLMAAVGRIDLAKIRTGHLSGEHWNKMVRVMGDLANAPVWIDDSSTLTLAKIAARAERVKREHGLKLVMVDYLQLLSGAGRFGSRQEEVSGISRGLKAMAKDLDVPVMALSQLTRAPDKEDREPQLSDLRESGAIEQDADVVMFLHRPHLFKSGATQEQRDETNLIVGKQRNGPTDRIKFVFLGRYTRFEEAVPEIFD